MNYTSKEYNFLLYVMSKNIMTYQEVLEWSYTQYTDDGIDPFIEKIVLSSDSEEVFQLVRNTFQVYGEISEELQIGEVASNFSNGKISLCKAVREILFGLDVELNKKDQELLYLADHLYDCYGNESDAIENEVENVLKPYALKYNKLIELFSV